MKNPSKRERIRESSAKYWRNHREQIQERRKAYDSNRNRSKETMDRYYSDDLFRTKHNLRSRLRLAFKAYSTRGKVGKAVDYDIDWNAICEKLGPRPGDNYHIDHIKPCCIFDHNDPIQVAECWSPENLQWLPASENLRKGGRYVD